MEFDEHNHLLDDLKMENFNELFPSGGWSFDSFDETPIFTTQNSSSLVEFDQSPFNEPYTFHNDFTVPDFDATPMLLLIDQEQCPSSILQDSELALLGKKTQLESFEQGTKMADDFDQTKKKKKNAKKLIGQPSKNLMAERRRRKRLNDRLSMLRSIVPRISKMDRTAILADTIEYMKELLERINKLQENQETDQDQMSLMVGIFKEITTNDDIVTRNSPKFDVERRNKETRVEICCPTRPGLLMSTVNTLETLLGLEIQQCVISCFNDFSMQASCSERNIMSSSEDMKQALFRNAGYGGTCL